MENAIEKKPASITWQKRCSYCGAELNPAFYFCIVCATPYKTIDDVVIPISTAVVESELIRKKAPHVWQVFWTYVVVLFVALLCNILLFSEEDQITNYFIFASILISITTIVFEVIFWRSLVVQLKRLGLFQWQTWLSFLILGGMLVICVGYNYLVKEYFQEYESWFIDDISSSMSPVLLFVLICLVPGIMEEIAFRGLIQHWLHTALKPWRAILLTSFLFTMLHLSILAFPYIFALSVLLGWTKWKTNSLYPSMIMHMVNNAFVVFVIPKFM